VLRALQAVTPLEESVLVASTGFTGRELYALDDRANQFYMVGSMGCASSLALGLSMVRPHLRVVVADGDGAALMRLGNFATIGAYAGPGFAQVVLDNGCHESTGGQATVSHGVRFAAIAAACGYAATVEAKNAQEAAALVPGDGIHGPRLAHIRTRPGVPEGLPRPAITPPDVVSRLLASLGSTPAWRNG
jgi:phosphonopyruvate decarboxylase